MLRVSAGESRLSSGVGPNKDAVPSQAGTAVQCPLAGRHSCVECSVGFYERGLPLSSIPVSLDL